MLYHQMLSLAVGSNIYTSHPHQPWQVSGQNPLIQPSMHQIFAQIYSTVSIGPSYIVSPTEFS